MFDPRRIKIFQGVKRKVRENTTPHLRYVNNRGTAVPQPLLVTVVFIVKGNALLFSVANYKLYVNSDRSNRTTSTLCCRHCPNCNRSSFSQIDLEIDFEQDKSMTIRGSAPCGEVHLNKSVIDLSMKQLIQKVSLTGSLQRGRNNVGRCTFTKVSLTSQ